MFKSNVIIEKRDLPISRQYDNLLSRSERDMRVALRKWFADTTKQVQRDLISQFSKARSKDITTYLTDWKRIEDNGKVVLKPVVLEVTRKGGQLSYKSLGISDKFDVTNPRAVSNVNKHCAKLVREVTTETKKGIRTFIRNGIAEGKGMPQIARDLRPIVGLTKRQVQSVANYKRMLKEAGQPADKIKKRVRKYRDRTHRRRMQTIARTETARAQNFGYVQGMEEIGINEVEFLIAAGACEICINLNTERFSIEEAEAVIPVHPNCRCAMLPVINDRTIQRPLVSAPPDLPGVMTPVKDLQPWRQYLASHRGGDKNVSAILYDWYKLNYQATGRLAPSAQKFLLKHARRLEASSVKIGVKIPGLPKPPVIKLVTEGSGSNIGNVGVLKELPVELSSGKTGADALTFVKDGKKYFAKRMRGDEIIQFQKEATAARAMEKVGLGKYTPKIHIAEGTYEGKRIRVIASEMIEKHRDLSALELSDKYRVLNTISDEVKERLVLQDYLMSTWDRSASNMMVKKGSVKMLDYELAFSTKAPMWTDHTLMQFLGKKIKVPAPDGKSFILRVHEGKISQYKFNKKVLHDTVNSAKNVKIAIDEMDIPNNLKILWKANVDNRTKELMKMAKQMDLVIKPIPPVIKPVVKIPFKPPTAKVTPEIQDLVTRWKTATSRSSKWTYGNKLKKLGYDVKTGAYKPLVKPVPTPKPLTTAEVKPGILPKSYYNEAPGDWEKRLVAHKEDLRKRFRFNLEETSLSRLSREDMKAAVAEMKRVATSYTKPANNLAKAKEATSVYDMTSPTPKTSFAAGYAKDNIAKVLTRFEEIGCDDLMAAFNRHSIHTRIQKQSYRSSARIHDFRLDMAIGEAPWVSFHEVGHLIERNPNIKRKAQRWVAARGKNVKMRWGDIRPSVTGSDARLSAYKDKFIDNYVGKVYDDGFTEVISMGIQQFKSYKSMLRFAKRDFDHFSFIHGILTGAI